MIGIGQSVPAAGGQASVLLQLVPFIFIFVVFYFLVMRPAQKRQANVRKMLEALKNGDRVITSGGILGTVAAVDRNVVQLRIADKVKVDVTKSSIVGLQDDSTSASAEP
jgi:preprotein translocase subunit YajC